jgi:ATP10 protein
MKCLAFLFGSVAMFAQDAALKIGDLLPKVTGQTLTKAQLELPLAMSGKTAVVMFSFSRAAGNDARAWGEHLLNEFSHTILPYHVIELEGVPRLMRGVAVSGIKGTMPPDVQKQAIVLYQDEDLWKKRLAVTDDKRCYVLVLGPDGRIRWTSSSAFSDSAHQALKKLL